MAEIHKISFDDKHLMSNLHRKLLHNVFGYSEFRGPQQAIVEHVVPAAMRWC